MDRLAQMTVFARVVETGSFTRAADSLGLAKSSVSRHIADLEGRLGVRLLNRTTRVVKATDVGQAYYARCATIIEDAEEADRAVRDEHGAPRGTLRIASSPAFATPWLMDAVAEFARTYPDIHLELLLEERLVHVVEEGIDVAIRIAPMVDSSLVAKVLGKSVTYLCASPAYLARRGHPTSPQDLREHDFLLREGANTQWVFERDEERMVVPVSGMLSSTDGASLVSAAMAGLGIAQLPDFLVQQHVCTGELKVLLRDWNPPVRTVHALYPHRRLLSPRVRLFVDHLASAWKPVAPWTVPCE